MPDIREQRAERGAAYMATLDPGLEGALRKGFASISPDFADMCVEFGYGEVMSRPGLDPKSRQFLTIGVLAALGHPTDQLKGHINGALSVGVTPQEIVEALMQVAVYAGFPAATNALRIAKRVFAERGVSPLPQSPAGDL
jgi:4-carboxymuconolactone decarboxylase